MAGLRPILMLLTLMMTATASAYEEPAYNVVHRNDDYEIRHYEPYMVAETIVPGDFDETGNTGFRRLAGYIFGDNRAPEASDAAAGQPVRMNMTVPVTRHRDAADGATVYRFVMERAYDRRTLPIPNANEVALKTVAGGPVAVMRYAGRITEARFRKHLALLRAALERDGFESVGEPMSAVFNGPFTLPPWRRNEAMIRAASLAPLDKVD